MLCTGLPHNIYLCALSMKMQGVITACAGGFNGVTDKPIPVFDELDVDGDTVAFKIIVETLRDWD
jgi:hypothetical protein